LSNNAIFEIFGFGGKYAPKDIAGGSGMRREEHFSQKGPIFPKNIRYSYD
jgi:hypothetical protein